MQFESHSDVLKRCQAFEKFSEHSIVEAFNMASLATFFADCSVAFLGDNVLIRYPVKVEQLVL